MLEYKYAGFWRRAFAYIIDIFVIILPCVSVILLMAFSFPCVSVILLMAFSGINGNNDLVGGLVGLFTMFVMAYHPLFHSSKYSATPGQQLLGIKVLYVGANKTDSVKVGETLSLLRAISRFLVYLFMNGMIITGIISAIFIAFSKRKQGLHDMICGTIVVRV